MPEEPLTQKTSLGHKRYPTLLVVNVEFQKVIRKCGGTFEHPLVRSYALWVDADVIRIAIEAMISPLKLFAKLVEHDVREQR